MVLVLSNLGLIHANRSWSHAIWRGSGKSSNMHFGWITLATVALLACVLGIPAISRLFAFALPTSGMLLAGAGVALMSLVWFEGVKWGLDRRLQPARQPVAPLELTIALLQPLRILKNPACRANR
jgi:Ca2+-transporting ATPase